MQEIQSVYLCGLGGVGSSYATRLHPLGCLKVIVDRERRRRYEAEPPLINGTPTRFEYLSPDESAPPADLMLIGVKRHQLEEAIEEIRNFVGEQTVIISLLNGIDSEEVLGGVFGMEKMLYAFVLGTDVIREGGTVNFAKLGTVVYGEAQNATHSERVQAVERLFQRAGIPYRIPENMIRELWAKLMMNVGVNQTSAVLGAAYGVYQQVEEAREALRMAAREVVRLSEKLGINLTEREIEDYIGVLCKLSPGGKTSMLQDIEAGRKTEVESFAGTVIRLGRQHGVSTPMNEMLYQMIRTLEKTRAR